MPNRIDVLRNKRGFSYGDIAKETGLTASYIYYLAKGKRKNPSFEVMQKISRALDESISYVFRINQIESE